MALGFRERSSDGDQNELGDRIEIKTPYGYTIHGTATGRSAAGIEVKGDDGGSCSVKPEIRQLRAAVKHIPGAWVRIWPDGTCWAGHKRNSRAAMDQVVQALQAAGWRTQCQGEPGTAGQFIIDIVGRIDDPVTTCARRK